YQAPRFDLTRTAPEDLVPYLAHDNYWWRITAQRLLVTRHDVSVASKLRDLFTSTKSPSGKVHALWTLEGLGALEATSLLTALNDVHPGVREQALRLAEPRLENSLPLRAALAGLVNDASPKVRFQLAFSLGAADAPELVDALAHIARKDA